MKRSTIEVPLDREEKNRFKLPNVPKVLHVVRCLEPIKGGTSEAIPASARATDATRRFTNHLLHFGDSASPVPAACADLPLRTLAWTPLQLLTTPHSVLKNEIAGFDIIHSHGIWEPQCAAAGRTARSLRRPYVISTHGMLEGWAVNNKSWKKRLYGSLAERENLRRANCLRALTRSELSDYRRYGLTGPVAIIPNGVTMPEGVSPRPFLESFPALEGKQIVLFLGRIHYKKGVDLLCRAWANAHRCFPDSHLVVAGPDSENTLASVRALVEDLGLQDSVTFSGMLSGAMKWSALRAASVFVLPSHSEGFSVAILEALASGLPVIATHACNFPEIWQRNAGILIRPEVNDVERALLELLAHSPAQLRAIGAQGRQLVLHGYTWAAIGQMMAEVYDWILGKCIPTNVEIDQVH